MNLKVAGLITAVVAALITAVGIAGTAVWFLSARIDSSRAEIRDVRTEVLSRMDQIAHDVAILTGRQIERDNRGAD